MNRRKFLKVISASAFAVTPLGSRVIDAMAASTVHSIAQTATPLTGDSTDTVAAPARGLGSNSNYYLASECNAVMGLSVTVEITKDLLSDIGFSIQLNANSAPAANHVGQQQYFMSLETSNGTPLKIYAWVDNWPSASFRQSLNLPPGGDMINSKQLMLTLPSATLPAGYKFTISLQYDGDQNVTGATYLIVDDQGKSTSSEIMLESLNVDHSKPAQRITSADLAPINAFQLNLVGPINNKSTHISAGAGTITYSASTPLTVLSEQPQCSTAQGIFTAESANTVYGTLPAGPSQTITQSFDIETPNLYTPGIPIAVSQQFGSNQTDLFAIDGVGQLAVFYVQENGHWHSSKAKGVVGLAHPGAAVAASQQFGVANQTDVFLIDQNGHLNVFTVDGAGHWSGPQLIGTKSIARPEANLAASQQFGAVNETDVFLVDKNGQLNVFSVVGAGQWSGPQLIGAAGLAFSGAALAASQQFGAANQTDVFLVDINGQLNVFSVDGTGNWSGPQTIGPTGFAPSGAAVAASQEFGAANQTDVFLVDKKGQLNVFSVVGAGNWSEPQPIGPVGLAHAGAALAASQDFAASSQTDVFLIDKNGQLNLFWVGASGHWNGPQTIGSAGLAPSGAVVAVSQQFGVTNQTDVFFINQTGANGPGWPTVFEAGASGTWNGPKMLVNET